MSATTRPPPGTGTEKRTISPYPSSIISTLGSVLPFAIMGMLVVFCMKNVSFIQSPHGIPEIIAGTVVVLLHVRKRNTLVSIIGGTACYMLLVQLVF